MTLEKALIAYVKMNVTRRLSPETIAKDKIVIRKLISWAKRKIIHHPDELDKKALREYLVALKGSGIKPITINGYKNTINRFCSWCIKQNYASINPLEGVRNMREDKLLPSYVPMKEMEALFASFEAANTLSVTQIIMFEFFYATGLRTSELSGLHINDLNLQKCLLRVRNGKGGKQRLVPFPDSLVPVMKRYMQIRESRHFTSLYLFPNAHGKRMHRVDTYNYIKRILDTTTSRKKGAHTLRSSYASHLLGRGANIKAISELLGHSSVKTTSGYAHLDIEAKRAIYEKAFPKA